MAHGEVSMWKGFLVGIFLTGCSASSGDPIIDYQRDDAVVERGTWQGQFVVSTMASTVSAADGCQAGTHLFAVGRGGDDGVFESHLTFAEDLAVGAIAEPTVATGLPDDVSPDGQPHLCWSTVEEEICLVGGEVAVTGSSSAALELSITGGQACSSGVCADNAEDTVLRVTLDSRFGSLDSADRLTCFSADPGGAPQHADTALCALGEASTCE